MTKKLPIIYKPSYLTEEKLQNIAKNKYNGKDNSILYRFVFGHFYNFLVNHVIPSWVAYIVVWIYSPSMNKEMPSWVYFFTAFCLFVYFTLDNCDGKQARKTNSSTPLGQLFDHGCDCITTSLILQNLCATIQAGASVRFAMFLLMGVPIFYFATWEEYMTDYFYLPELNGPDEGLFLITVMFIHGGFDPNFWKKSTFGIENFNYLFVFTLFLFVVTAAGNFKNAMKGDHFKESSKLYIFKSLSPCFLTSLFGSLWIYFRFELFLKHPRLVMTSIGFIFANINLRVLVAHVSKDFGNWYIKKRFLMLFAIPIAYYLFGWIVISEETFLRFYAFF
ncbi:hypothetical protein M0811_14295 [Anaeramoeba ignava]|uniref:Uncharacterized protein n=1 Tax=Anaeramoeba ignava TaxID=1746090 RepID=A0A9Q0LY29_ANAIG|nr:hypothetical protein M0811_14295 [Anaeramoeba ignava]